MSVFWNPGEGRLRVGWRLAVHAALIAAFGALPVVAIAEPLTLTFAALHVFTANASLASFLGVFVNALFFAVALF